MTLRSDLYRAARILGDIEAIRQGPAAVLRRHVRKATYRRTNGALSSILRAILGK